jgi:hypothetical protein
MPDFEKFHHLGSFPNQGSQQVEVDNLNTLTFQKHDQRRPMTRRDRITPPPRLHRAEGQIQRPIDVLPSTRAEKVYDLSMRLRVSHYHFVHYARNNVNIFAKRFLRPPATYNNMQSI